MTGTGAEKTSKTEEVLSLKWFSVDKQTFKEMRMMSLHFFKNYFWIKSKPTLSTAEVVNIWQPSSSSGVKWVSQVQSCFLITCSHHKDTHHSLVAISAARAAAVKGCAGLSLHKWPSQGRHEQCDLPAIGVCPHIRKDTCLVSLAATSQLNQQPDLGKSQPNHIKFHTQNRQTSTSQCILKGALKRLAVTLKHWQLYN